MRLTCPNCGAQYEVPANVLPDEGRDVQCSNCGQTWFQEHPDSVLSGRTNRAPLPQEDEEVVSADPDHYSAPRPAQEEEPIIAETEEPDQDETEPAAPDTEPSEETSPPPVRRELDPAVASVLRAEAELEEKARRRYSSMESQPDLGLTEAQDDAAKRAREARERMARIRGENLTTEDPDETASDTLSPVIGSRRDLLPDIEEINSTLRSNNDRSPTTDPGQTAQIEVRAKRGSRLGFVLTVALVVCLALLYVYAPQLADAVPQAEPALASYVSVIDTWRLWLDEKVSSMLSWLDAVAVSSAR